MVRAQLQNLFEKVQQTTGCHQKCVIILTDIYKKVPEEEFLQTFLQFVKLIVFQNIDNAKYSTRCLNFISLFCADITKKQGKENECHNFLTAVVEKILEWSCLSSYDVRYNCCYFLAQVFQDIGEEVQLEIKLIDDIQVVLLERMQETKIPIRIIAMSALVRLQDPQNFECPVIQAYIQATTSGSPQIRKESIQRIAPNVITLSIIKDRIRDTDPGVRLVAFQKCADIGPLNFRIADKHMILLCGFQETSEKVKNIFVDYLLVKWLTAYQGNCLKFVEALKFLALEEDFNKMAFLSNELITTFYNTQSVNDLVAVLPLNNEKLIDTENISNGVTLFWNILVSILRGSKDMEDQLDKILPELTSFCNFIDRVIKIKSSEQMDEWRFQEYQFDLLNLLEIAENYDFSDEVGRRTMHTLSMRLLQNHNLSLNLTRKIVVIAHKCSSNIEFFTNDICQIISDIREPMVAEPVSEDQRRKRDFRMAELRVKINICEERQNEAIHTREFQKAQALDEELSKLKNQLETFQTDSDIEKVRVTKSDSDTLCRCLDILASVLELPAITKLTPSLVTARDQFLVQLISITKAELHWRVLKSLALFSLVDRATAEEYAKIICIPIVTYRAIPTSNVTALTQAIPSVTDLISCYGIEILGEEETVNLPKDDSTKRKLYSTNSEDDMKVANVTSLSIFEIFIDMLDDEHQEVRLKAVLAITVMLKEGFPVTPLLLSRILLKWYSPVTGKTDSRLQVYLGLLIQQYIQFKRSGPVIKDAIIPTLTTIVRAPKTSHLSTIDVDNVLLFFSEVMNINLEKADLKKLAFDVCLKISENPNDRIVTLLVKFLSRLDIEDTDVADGMIEQAEMMLENVSDRTTRRYIERFLSKLKLLQANITQNTTRCTNLETNEFKEGEEINRSVESNHMGKKTSLQIKRSKHRGGKDCVVVLEKRTEEVNETTLHTIMETSMEMEADNNLTIETCTSDLSKSSSNLRQSNVVVSQALNSSNKGNVNLREIARPTGVLTPVNESAEELVTRSQQKRRIRTRNGYKRLIVLGKNNFKQRLETSNESDLRNQKKQKTNIQQNTPPPKENTKNKKKRRKYEINDCVIVLENIKDKHESRLPTQVNIESDNIVSSDISDSSDFSADSELKLRRSGRNRKKKPELNL